MCVHVCVSVPSTLFFETCVAVTELLVTFLLLLPTPHLLSRPKPELRYLAFQWTVTVPFPHTEQHSFRPQLAYAHKHHVVSFSRRFPRWWAPASMQKPCSTSKVTCRQPVWPCCELHLPDPCKDLGCFLRNHVDFQVRPCWSITGFQPQTLTEDSKYCCKPLRLLVLIINITDNLSGLSLMGQVFTIPCMAMVSWYHGWTFARFGWFQIFGRPWLWRLNLLFKMPGTMYMLFKLKSCCWPGGSNAF